MDSQAGHLHPLKYTIGLAAAAQAAGVRLYEGSRVTSMERGPIVTLRTANGSVRARYVALCGNIGHGEFVPALARRMIGVASYIVATQPLGAERAQALLRDNVAVADVNWVIDYYRLSSDQRLLFGGRVSYSGLDPIGRGGAGDADSAAERVPPPYTKSTTPGAGPRISMNARLTSAIDHNIITCGFLRRHVLPLAGRSSPRDRGRSDVRHLRALRTNLTGGMLLRRPTWFSRCYGYGRWTFPDSFRLILTAFLASAASSTGLPSCRMPVTGYR